MKSLDHTLTGFMAALIPVNLSTLFLAAGRYDPATVAIAFFGLFLSLTYLSTRFATPHG
jgi:hypothetical protein